MAEPESESPEWVAKRQIDVARFCGVSLDTVKSWAKQGMPGLPGEYNLADVVQWLRQAGPWRQHLKVTDDDPLMDDTDSPGLERYRQAKAAIAELDYAERQKELMARDKVKALFVRWAAVLRRMGERISKRFGNDAAITVNDALRECSEIVTYELGGTNATDTTTD